MRQTKIITNKRKIDDIISRGVEEVLVKKNIEKRLRSGKRLRVKLGIDPSGSQLHIGHAVVLRKLRAFQELGHEIMLIVGSFTGMIGDPSGKTQTRAVLTEAQVKKHFAAYKRQASKVIDVKKATVLYNHTWLKKLNFSEILRVAGAFTVSQMLERDMYQERMKKGFPISLPEFFYPLMQGYDSVHIRADVELGASDQLFNILAGRTIQKHFGIEEQDLIVTPLLIGLDGKKKMGKSEGNFIAIEDPAGEMYGKVMSIPDNLITHYFELATTVSMNEIKKIREHLKKRGVNPRDVKMRLAREIVTLYHGAHAAQGAEKEFIKTFQKKDIPNNMPTFAIRAAGGVSIVAVSAAAFRISRSEARRAIAQKGLKKNQQVVTDVNEKVKPGDILQKGKRHFVKVVTK